MRVAYCEDEPAQARLLVKKITDWARIQGEEIEVDVYASAEEYLFKADRYAYTLLFLDISMGKMNGMELARLIRQKDTEVILVFVTSDASFVFDGYEVGAYRYLVKPIQPDKLEEVLAFAAGSKKEEERYVILRVENENRRILPQEVCYIEVQGHYVRLQLSGGKTLTIKAGFADIFRKMNETGQVFIQTHRSYAVNLSRVDRIGRTECRLENGDVLPVSKSAYKALNEAFIRLHTKG